MKNFAWLLLALSALSLTGVDEAAARARTPREQCNLNARTEYKKCRRAGHHGSVCFKARKKAYAQCRRTTPPNRPAQR